MKNRFTSNYSRSLLALVVCGFLGTGLMACGESPVETADAGTNPDTCNDDAGVPDAGTPDAGIDPDLKPEIGLQIVDGDGPIDITPSGRIAVIQENATGDVYFYDTVTKERNYVASVGDPSMSTATAISSNLRLSALQGDPVEAAFWSETQGWVILPSMFETGCDAHNGGAFDISADGHTVVGLNFNGCHAEAFRWSDASGTGVMTPLQILGDYVTGTPSNRASVVSDDGKVIGGFAANGNLGRTPAIWREDGTGVLLDPTQTELDGEVQVMSADGAFVAGRTGSNAFIWSQETGKITLPRQEGFEYHNVTPTAVSADGKLVFGVYRATPLSFGPDAPFVWTPTGGTRSLIDVARAAGIVIPENIQLAGAFSASADGTVVIGTAFDISNPNEPATIKSFVLVMPVSAYL